MIASSSLFRYISDFKISDKDNSDHFPLICQLCFESTQTNYSTSNIYDSNVRLWQKFIWKDELKDDFYNKFCINFRCFKENLRNRNDRTFSSYISDFINVFQTAGENMKSNSKYFTSSQPEWWDHECNIAKI